jgi:hypothetical protein
MLNNFGLPGHSVENSWVGLVISAIVIFFAVSAAGALYLLVE